MRILLYSVAPWFKTGYGDQCARLARFLRDSGHTVAIAAYRGLSGTSVEWEGIQIQPWTAHTRFSAEVLPYYYAQHEADLCLTLTDLFIFEELIPALKEQAARPGGMRFAHWMPVDASPLGWPDHHILTAGRGIPLAMSRFGEAQLHDAGFAPLYFPHAIDTTLHTPRPPEAIAEVRRRLGIAPGAFLIGNIAANESNADRKGFWEQLSAFAAFRAQVPAHLPWKPQLYLHTLRNRHPAGLDLESMCDRLKLTGSVHFPDEHLYKTGAITEEMLALITASFDLYTGCARAEGFGLPIAEAQACGVPAVVTNAAAMAEVAEPGWQVDCQSTWSPLHASGWAAPSIPAITAVYARAWGMWRQDQDGNGQMWGTRKAAARAHAMSYSQDTVPEKYWAPAMKLIEERISA